MNRKNLVFAVLVTALFVFVIGATWVVATDGDVIHACVAQPNSENQSKNLNGQANTGSVRIVSSDADCRNGEDHITWNIVGPQGPQGPQGIQGVKGDPGANGAPGADGADGESWYDAQIYQRYGGSMYLNVGWWNWAIVSCPAGETMISAGHYNSAPGFNAFQSYPRNRSQWFFYMQNTGPYSGYVSFYALCAAPSSLTTTAATESGENNLIVEVGEPHESWPPE